MGRNKTTLLVLVLIMAGKIAYGQTNRYLVHLADKENSPFSIDSPELFLSQRAIERRTKQGITISEQDIPVNPGYYDGIDQIDGVKAHFSTKWLNGVMVECDASLISQLEALTYVTSVEYVAPGSKIENLSPGNYPPVSDNNDSQQKRRKRRKEVASDFQNEMLGVNELHEDGFTGEGVLVAVMDGGFFGAEDLLAFERLYTQGKVIHTFDYVTGQQDVYKYTNHGTKVFSILGAYLEDEYIGIAYDSDFMLFVTEDDCAQCEHRIEEYNWVFAAEFADSAGVDVINTSLGYNLFEDPSMDYTHSDLNGNTAIITIASDIAFSKGILITASTGNEGNNSWGTITTPADGNNVLAVGNITSSGTRAPSSSIGPSADQRIKPDVSALGSSVQVISSSGLIVSGSGTSFSSPQVAGLSALITQAYPNLSAQDIRFLMLETASNAMNPNNEIGYGVPNFLAFENYLNFSDSNETFILYPNPVENNQLVIRANNPGATSRVYLQIFSSSGQVIQEQELTFTWQNNSQIVEMSSLSSGVYIFNLSSANGVERLQIVKI